VSDILPGKGKKKATECKGGRGSASERAGGRRREKE
jgi:hypothetical protein